MPKKSIKHGPKATAEVLAKSKVDKAQNEVISRLSKVVSKLKPEVKYIMQAAYGTDTSVTIASPTNFGLNPIALGTGLQNRIGGKCFMKYLNMRLSLFDTSGLGSTNSVRVLIVNQKHNNGSTQLDTDGTFTANNILDGLFAVGDDVTISKVTSMLQILGAQKSNFKVLFDKTYRTNVERGYVQNIHIKRKLDFVTDYSLDDDGDMADIDSNALYLYICTDSSTTNAITARWHYWISFTDS